jgi:hypothetical protein
MTQISDFGRVVADQIVSSAKTFGDGLAQSIANNKSGHWAPGPLWDNAILAMRTQGGSLAQNLENLKLMGPEVYEQLSPALRAQYDTQLADVAHVLDEIHTDQGGTFANLLTDFRVFGDQAAAEIREILRKADEAEASAARVSVQGVQTLGWDLVEDAGKATVKETEQAAEHTKTMAAGGRG